MYSSSGGFHIAHSTFEGDGVGSFSFQTELELKKRVSPGADQSRFGFVPPSSRSARSTRATAHCTHSCTRCMPQHSARRMTRVALSRRRQRSSSARSAPGTSRPGASPAWRGSSRSCGASGGGYIASTAVLEAAGSVFTNKYAEGYPRKRWYGGCEHVDMVEDLAIARAKELFGADHANVQPHSGSQANFAVYTSVLQPGDKVLGMNLAHGGHLTHGNPVNFSGKLYEFVQYGVREDTGLIDYDELASIAEKEKPKMITVGASAYSRIINFEHMGEIARSVGAYLFADIAHISGLVAGGMHPSPVPHADFVTTTTHKTLRGPRGGLILCKAEHAKAIDSAMFPGGQGGPLMHVIAAKAVAFGEALRPDFKQYINNNYKNDNVFYRKGYHGGWPNSSKLIDILNNIL